VGFAVAALVAIAVRFASRDEAGERRLPRVIDESVGMFAIRRALGQPTEAASDRDAVRAEAEANAAAEAAARLRQDVIAYRIGVPGAPPPTLPTRFVVSKRRPRPTHPAGRAGRDAAGRRRPADGSRARCRSSAGSRASSRSRRRPRRVRRAVAAARAAGEVLSATGTPGARGAGGQPGGWRSERGDDPGGGPVSEAPPCRRASAAIAGSAQPRVPPGRAAIATFAVAPPTPARPAPHAPAHPATTPPPPSRRPPAPARRHPRPTPSSRRPTPPTARRRPHPGQTRRPVAASRAPSDRAKRVSAWSRHPLRRWRLRGALCYTPAALSGRP
jgi:hypothetical protein